MPYGAYWSPMDGKGAMTETREMYEIPSEQLTQHDLDELRRLTQFASGAFPDNMRRLRRLLDDYEALKVRVFDLERLNAAQRDLTGELIRDNVRQRIQAEAQAGTP